MSNRSYLFSMPKKCGISNFSYDIPLSYKILVSQDASIVKSIIWNIPELIAIQGSFIKGRQKLYSFFDELLNLNMLDNFLLLKKINNTKEFLDSHDIQGDFFHLENGEIYDMNDFDLETQNNIFFENEILKIDKIIESTLKELNELKQKLNLKSKPSKDSEQEQMINDLTNMWNILGLDSWDRNLYYS